MSCSPSGKLGLVAIVTGSVLGLAPASCTQPSPQQTAVNHEDVARSRSRSSAPDSWESSSRKQADLGGDQENAIESDKASARTGDISTPEGDLSDSVRSPSCLSLAVEPQSLDLGTADADARLTGMVRITNRSSRVVAIRFVPGVRSMKFDLGDREGSQVGWINLEADAEMRLLVSVRASRSEGPQVQKFAIMVDGGPVMMCEVRYEVRQPR